MNNKFNSFQVCFISKLKKTFIQFILQNGLTYFVVFCLILLSIIRKINLNFLPIVPQVKVRKLKHCFDVTNKAGLLKSQYLLVFALNRQIAFCLFDKRRFIFVYLAKDGLFLFTRRCNMP